MIRFIFRLVRYALMAALGAAVAAKLALRSRAEPETDEIDMVAVFEGAHLVSTAEPFYGGRILGMFAGIILDLRRAQPGPTGVHLDLNLVCAGVKIVVPEGWRVHPEIRLYAGGFADETVTTADTDVPILTLTGFVAMSGIQVLSKPTVDVVRA